ncbi:MAG: hypothetical protein JXR56_08090 [Candidatus Cloacimonetes bacterium]|nr:hypothetical protein [Candidatus Cloacimonadota bacterium]
MPPKKPIAIEKSRLLLVEGKDEIGFFECMLKHLEITNIQILDVKGKENFKNEIPLLRKLPGFNIVEKIGIVRDADDNYSATIKSIRDSLKKSEFVVDDNPCSFSAGTPNVGFFIMPDNSSNGELEDLCLDAVKNTEVLECVENNIKCIQVKKENLKKMAKRKVQIFLASQDEIVNSLGLGAQKHYWDFESPVYDSLKQFLKELAD